MQNLIQFLCFQGMAAYTVQPLQALVSRKPLDPKLLEEPEGGELGGKRPLEAACFLGDTSLVSSLLGLGAMAWHPSWGTSNSTPAHLAVCHANAGLAASL